ncbi:MAG: DUF1800 domain-containing protein [Acidobacteriota bacterium]
MRLKKIFVFILSLALIAPTVSAQQDSALFDPLITRISQALSLNADQVAALRRILDAHAAKVIELQRRARSQPFSPQLQADVEQEQRAIREEFSAHLTDEQKTKLTSLNARLPVPIAPPFVAVNIAPRARVSVSAPLADSEKLALTANRTGRMSEDQKIIHLLNRATFGPRPGDAERVRQMSVNKFLEEQLHPETIDEAELEQRLGALSTLRMTSVELYQFYPPPAAVEAREKQPNPPPIFGRPPQIYVELVQQKIIRAASANRQLQEVMVDFWFNHFNVFAQKDAVQWMITSFERDVIRPNAMGRFRDLLLSVAESPAMLFYLDNWLSSATDAREPRPSVSQPPRPQNARQAPGADPASPQMMNPQPPPRPPARRRDINENYARELMELHTLGVDGGYTQRDVQEVARCFTGWTIDRPFQGGGFMFRPWMHDAGAKTVLGVAVKAGGGILDGRRVIDILARHPSTARFISRKLCQRFVSDDPSPQLVERVAQVFLKTDGDIRESLRAIFTSPEFYSPSSFRSKVKSPLELAASAIRAIDADTNGAPALHEWIRRMGEPLYQQQAPTGYSENSRGWINTGVFLNRINFLTALSTGQIAGTSYDPARLLSADAIADAESMTNKLTALILHTELSAESRRAVRAGLNEPPPQPRPAVVDERTIRAQTAPAVMTRSKLDPASSRRAAQAISLLFASAEFQRR